MQWAVYKVLSPLILQFIFKNMGGLVVTPRFNSYAFLSLMGRSSVAALSVALVSTSPAFAQSAATAGAGAKTDDIMVTARRSSERLDKVPLSINALTADALLTKGVQNLQDVANATPGLRYTDFLSKFNGNAVIRGLAAKCAERGRQHRRISGRDLSPARLYGGFPAWRYGADRGR
jgi:outer membrane receptor protein involved in Fe transport